MTKFKGFEAKHIQELLDELDRIFIHHSSHQEMDDMLNVMNLSMRRIVEILHESDTKDAVSQQVNDLEGKLNQHVDQYVSSKQGDEIHQFVAAFMKLVHQYTDFVKSDTSSMIDICNVFRVVTDVYLTADRKQTKALEEIKDGAHQLVNDWLSGKVSPPSSDEEVPDSIFQEDIDIQYQTLLFDVHEDIARITLHRPQVRNAMNQRMVIELHQAFLRVEKEKDIRMVILTGSGDAFCAGADLGEMANVDDDQPNFAVALGKMLKQASYCTKPTVALVNGPVMGGGIGLMCTADIILAAEDVMFSFPEVRLGLIPAMISAFVIERMGVIQARRLFLTGEHFTAAQAMSWQLVNEVVAPEELEEVGQAYVKRLHAGAPNALADCKRLIQYVSKHPLTESLDYASQVFTRILGQAEAKEGVQAFLEKRKPAWK